MTQERAPERERPQLERSLARLPGRWQKTVSRIPRNRERAGSRRIHSARNRRVLLDLTVVPVSDSSSLFGLRVLFIELKRHSKQQPHDQLPGLQYQGRVLLAGDPVGPAGRCDHAGVHLRKGRRRRVGGCAC